MSGIDWGPVSKLEQLNGTVGTDPRFSGTRTPHVAEIPGFPQLGFGSTEAEAAAEVLRKYEAAGKPALVVH